MASPPKVLILDDDPDFLEVCQQMLAALPSKPEIFTATAGSRALALLESETFSLLLTDLRMPRMDGFQVLSIVRRRLPSQRIVVMTGAVDEAIRTRAYAMGIDLFIEKPKTPGETQLFFECIESMLEQESLSGFRGVVERKGLVDIVQMECLTQSSAILKITSGKSVGYIWFLKGEIIDAATATAKAEAAFAEILSWRVGNFDLLPPDFHRTRTIHASADMLLLNTAHSLDEANAEKAGREVEAKVAGPVATRLAELGRMRGVEFLLTQDDATGQVERWSCEEADEVAAWAQRLLGEYRELGAALGVSGPVRLEACGPQRHLAVANNGQLTMVAGLEHTLNPRQATSTFGEILSKWGF